MRELPGRNMIGTSERQNANGRTCAGHKSIRQCTRYVSTVGTGGAWYVITACPIRTRQLNALKFRVSAWFWPSQPSGSGGNIPSVRGPGQFEKKQRKLEGGTTPRYCWTFNAGAKCSYESCKFAHICSECNGEHPKVSCNNPKASKGPGPMKRFRRGA